MGFELVEKVQRMLDEEGVRAEVFAFPRGLPAVVVSIPWGDWKHEHARAKWLCKMHGGMVMSTVVTEEDGSDCFSAEHSIAFFAGFKE